MRAIDDALGQLCTYLGVDGDVHRECRRCGTTLSPDHDSCPACGSNEIAAIDLC